MNTGSEHKQGGSTMATVVLSIGLLYVALRKIGAIGDSDVWWHLRTGDLIRATGSVPRFDPFSWTAGGESWHPNAWMSDVLFSWMRSIGGLTALSIYRSLGSVLVGALLWTVVRRGRQGAWATAAAVFPAVLFSTPFITERPQVIGFVAFTLLMLMIPSALTGSWRAIVGIGVLLAFWANLHGSFIMGVGVVGLVALGTVIGKGTWRSPVMLVMASVLAPLLNPYGYFVYRQALSIPGVSSFIDEWRRFDLWDTRDRWIALFTLIALVGMWRTGRWKVWELSLPTMALILLTARAIRTAPFLVMWETPLFAAALSSLKIPRVRAWASSRTQPMAIGLMIAGAVVSGSMVGQIRDAGSIDRETVPVSAIDAFPTGCVLLNEYEFGGFIIDRRWPDLLVSQDGRNDLYGLERIELQESWLEGDDLTPLDEEGINCVLARPSRPLATALRSETSWSILSESDLAVAFTRNDY